MRMRRAEAEAREMQAEDHLTSAGAVRPTARGLHMLVSRPSRARHLAKLVY